MRSPEKLLEVIRLQTDIVKQGPDLGSTMTVVVDHVLHLLGADGAAIEMLEGHEMVYRAVSGIASADLGLRLPVESSLSGLSTRSGEVLVCADSEIDLRVDREACRHLGLRSMVVTPLRFNQNTVGVLKAMSRQPDYFHDEHLYVLNLLTELVAASMYFATRFDSDELYYRATHDAMTGLANRALFMDKLRSALLQSQRHPQTFGILMADIDGLKRVNDSLGHRAGDTLITEFSQRLKQSARSTDLVARLGGDEFGMILMPVDGDTGIHTVEQRMKQTISGEITIDGQTLPVSGSIGVALCPSDGSDLQKLIDVADARMYELKRAHYRTAETTSAL